LSIPARAPPASKELDRNRRRTTHVVARGTFGNDGASTMAEVQQFVHPTYGNPFGCTDNPTHQEGPLGEHRVIKDGHGALHAVRQPAIAMRDSIALRSPACQDVRVQPGVVGLPVAAVTERRGRGWFRRIGGRDGPGAMVADAALDFEKRRANQPEQQSHNGSEHMRPVKLQLAKFLLEDAL
jgi:hypothetical protein